MAEADETITIATLIDMATHYEVLGVSQDASNQDIAKAYFRRTSGSRSAGFLKGSKQSRGDRKMIEEAYAVLVDRSRRIAYDQSLDHNA